MSGTRRFSITKGQGELISLALTALIAELEEILRNNPSAYLKIMLERARLLKHDLSTYTWYKTK